MCLAPIFARYAAVLRRLALGILAHVPSARLRRICGRVQTTENTARRDVLLQLQREALAQQIRDARRKNRRVSHLHKQACSITNEILRGGL